MYYKNNRKYNFNKKVKFDFSKINLQEKSKNWIYLVLKQHKS